MKTEEQLRLQAAALEHAANSIAITDRRGHFLWVNPAFSKLTGYAMAEVLNATPRILKSGRHKEEFYRGLWQTLLAKKTWHGEFINRRKDGSLYHAEQTITPVCSDDGEVTHFIGIMNDVTERKNLENQLLRVQRMESIGTLAGGIAHDLNNALTPILMSVEILQSQLSNPDDLALTNLLQASAQRGAEMVKQLLTFSRGIEGERVELQLKHLVREMQSIIRQTFPKNIRFQTDIEKNVAGVIGDATQLHQVLLNLCVNARDAMPHGGALTIKLANAEIDEQFAGMSIDAKAGPYVALSVADTGTGIPPEIRERIFDPFFTTKAIDKGTGLGLSTVQGIVKSHGGFISVQSEMGKGAEFKIYLPAQTSNTQGSSAQAAADLPMGKAELILVVDDEEAIRTLTRKTLEAFGYNVLTAYDGAQAVALCAQHEGKMDLVLTDVVMPIMDGRAAMRAIRTLDPARKVILMSGVDAEGKPGASENEANAFIQKPFTAEQLLKTIRSVLDLA